jgi:hypothetical protein
VTRGMVYQLRDLDGEVQESSVFEQMKVLDRGNFGNAESNKRPGWRRAVYLNRRRSCVEVTRGMAYQIIDLDREV